MSRLYDCLDHVTDVLLDRLYSPTFPPIYFNELDTAMDDLMDMLDVLYTGLHHMPMRLTADQKLIHTQKALRVAQRYLMDMQPRQDAAVAHMNLTYLLWMMPTHIVVSV